MGESRDAVKAASEIGRDHDGKVCPEQAIDISVIAVTFRGAAWGNGWRRLRLWLPPVLRRDSKLAAVG
jgi:hypothetical protein